MIVNLGPVNSIIFGSAFYRFVLFAEAGLILDTWRLIAHSRLNKKLVILAKPRHPKLDLGSPWNTLIPSNAVLPTLVCLVLIRPTVIPLKNGSPLEYSVV